MECYAIEDAPDVLSLGKRCQKYGYGFYWDPYSSTPYMTHPDGHIIPLSAIDYVPYLADFWNTENAPIMSYLPDSPMSATGKRGASDDTLVHDRTKATRYIMLPKKDMHLWPRVRTRTTYDKKTGGLIAVHTVKDMTEEELRAPLPDGPCDIHVIFELDKESDGKATDPRDSDEKTKVVVPEPSVSEEQRKRIADLEDLVSEAVEGADVGALPPSKVGKGDKESPRPSGNRPAGSLEPEGVAQHAEGRIEPVAPLSLPHLESSAEKAVKIVTPEEEATFAEKESRQHELARQAKSVTHSFCHRFK